MGPNSTQMKREVLEIPDAVERLLTNRSEDIRRAAIALRATNPLFFVSVARGSSDHVATYLKYVTELLLGITTSSIGPSIASVYKRPVNVRGSACLSVSQSGQSPDIVEMTKVAREQGALSVAFTNDPSSRLAKVSDYTLNLDAGPEKSVAATKTFVNSSVAGLWLLAEFAQDEELLKAIRHLPEHLHKAVQIDWSAASESVENNGSVFCVGRGPSLAMANEAALKFKETCQIHAESYSSAEVLHGPVSIVEARFPVLAFAAADDAENALSNVADEISSKGACVFATSHKVKSAQSLPFIRTDHPLTDPISLISSFYVMVEEVSRKRGINPDKPRHLNKVTETV